ncbi:MAG: efflux RND transporter periplasmic adaptor subunit [Gemmataceae bacterium]|nr:efflux RND transporter periplasmic adaptor subunit [Gemmataceae bacterium]
MKRVLWLGVLSAALTLAAGLVATSGWGSTPSSGWEAQADADAAEWVHGLGYVEPVGEVRRLVFKGGGVLDRCPVAVGQAVRQGEMLMALRDDEQREAVAVAEWEVELTRAERDKVVSGINRHRIAAAESRLALQHEQLSHAAREYDRSRSLFRGRAISDLEMEAARTLLEQRGAAVRTEEAEVLHLKNHITPEDRQLAEARVRLAEARLGAARQRLLDTVLTAPGDGTVLEILKREGEGVRTGDAEPVVVFADLARLRVRAEIDERHVNRLRPGQRARVGGRGLGHTAFEGVVTTVKGIMGKKTVLARSATERKDLDVLQVFIELETSFPVPVWLEVDVQIHVSEQTSQEGLRLGTLTSLRLNRKADRSCNSPRCVN